MSAPTAAPAHFPYNHRTLAQVDADRVRDLRNAVQLEVLRKTNPEMFEPMPRWGNPEYVHRDPCPMCGVRVDLGCAHRKVAA
jgi:hypothetical protein